MIYKKLTVLTIVIVLILAISSIDAAKPQTSRDRVVIRPNGNVEPSSASIQRNGDRYTFTGNVSARLVVERGGIVIDGAGYTLHGPYNGTMENIWVIGGGADQVTPGMQINYSIGVDFSGDASGLTIMNLNIKNFSIGTYIWTKNNTFIGNSVSECVVGVLLSGSNNSVTRNYVTRNEIGLFFGTTESGSVPLNLTVSHNSFNNNSRQLGGCLCQQQYNASEPIHTWDNGKEGNYWSDYNGTDQNGDDIGDTAYVFDPQNEDRYPLMTSAASPPIVASGISVFTIILVVVAVIIAIAAALITWSIKRRKKNCLKKT